MKTNLVSAAVLALLATAYLPAAHADHDYRSSWWQSWEDRQRWEERQRWERQRQEELRRWQEREAQREAQRESERAQRQLRQHQRIAEAERSMGIERPNPTIDTRTQRLPPAPQGHEWQTAPNGDFLLVISSTGQVVQLVRNITPSGPVAP